MPRAGISVFPLLLRPQGFIHCPACVTAQARLLGTASSVPSACGQRCQLLALCPVSSQKPSSILLTPKAGKARGLLFAESLCFFRVSHCW